MKTELETEFEELNRIVSSSTDEKREQNVSQMKANLIERGVESQIVESISDVSELRRFNAEIIEKENAKKRDDINNEARETMLSTNKYSQDSPYYK